MNCCYTSPNKAAAIMGRTGILGGANPHSNERLRFSALTRLRLTCTRRQLDMEDSPEPLDGLRRRIVMQLTREGKSQREIGSSLGVDQKTISNDVRYEENSSKPSLSSEDKLAKN